MSEHVDLSALCRFEDEAIRALRDRICVYVDPSVALSDVPRERLDLVHLIILDELGNRVSRLFDCRLVVAEEAPHVRASVTIDKVVGFAAAKAAYHRARQTVGQVSGHFQFSIGSAGTADGGAGRGTRKASARNFANLS